MRGSDIRLAIFGFTLIAIGAELVLVADLIDTWILLPEALAAVAAGLGVSYMAFSKKFRVYPERARSRSARNSLKRL